MNDRNFKQYDTRNTEMLGEHYARHLEAMTCKQLEAKSAIAAELAFRDWALEKTVESIRSLRQERDELRRKLEEAQADRDLVNFVESSEAVVESVYAEHAGDGFLVSPAPYAKDFFGTTWREAVRKAKESAG